MTSDAFLNGRRAREFELAAIRRGRQCEADRDLAVIAGLATETPPRVVPPPDLPQVHAQIRGRRGAIDLDLPVPR